MLSADRTDLKRHDARQRGTAGWIVFTRIAFVQTAIFAFAVLGVGAYPFGNANDAVGPQETHHQSWLATLAWLAASTIAVGELILLLLITRSELRRRRVR